MSSATGRKPDKEALIGNVPTIGMFDQSQNLKPDLQNLKPDSISISDVKNIDTYRQLPIRGKSLTSDKKIENIDF